MDRLRKKETRIAVIGDLMIDHYIWGNCERISPEAPVQVLEVNRENSLLGGAENSSTISLHSTARYQSTVSSETMRVPIWQRSFSEMRAQSVRR